MMDLQAVLAIWRALTPALSGRPCHKLSCYITSATHPFYMKKEIVKPEDAQTELAWRGLSEVSFELPLAREDLVKIPDIQGQTLIISYPAKKQDFLHKPQGPKCLQAVAGGTRQASSRDSCRDGPCDKNHRARKMMRGGRLS